MSGHDRVVRARDVREEAHAAAVPARTRRDRASRREAVAPGRSSKRPSELVRARSITPNRRGAVYKKSSSPDVLVRGGVRELPPRSGLVVSIAIRSIPRKRGCRATCRTVAAVAVVLAMNGRGGTLLPARLWHRRWRRDRRWRPGRRPGRCRRSGRRTRATGSAGGRRGAWCGQRIPHPTPRATGKKRRLSTRRPARARPATRGAARRAPRATGASRTSATCAATPRTGSR